MSEKRSRHKRLAEQAEQPAQQPTTTIADLLQLLGAKDVEILGLQRGQAALQQQVQTLAKQLAKRAKATT